MRFDWLPPGLAQFVRYGITGVFTNGSIYCIFLAMIWLGTQPVLASGLCYGLGVALSYLINRRWTFASDSSHGRDLPRFLASYGVGLLTTLVSMTLLIKVMRPEFAQLVTVVITAFTIYGSLLLLRFGRSADSRNEVRDQNPR